MADIKNLLLKVDAVHSLGRVSVKVMGRTGILHFKANNMRLVKVTGFFASSECPKEWIPLLKNMAVKYRDDFYPKYRRKKGEKNAKNRN